MEISWRTANGVQRGEVVRTDTRYLVRLDSGKFVVVHESSVIERFHDDDDGGDEISLF